MAAKFWAASSNVAEISPATAVPAGKADTWGRQMESGSQSAGSAIRASAVPGTYNETSALRRDMPSILLKSAAEREYGGNGSSWQGSRTTVSW